MAFQRRKPAAIGVKAPFPGFIEPALATSIERVPEGQRWIHEIKFDGYRIQMHIANEDVKVFTRRGNDWTKRFKKIANDAFLISASSAIIDGEVVVPAADGTTDFSVLQSELKGKSHKIAMVAFDLLYLNGYNLRKLPLVERKALLKKLIAKTAIQFSESFEVNGSEMFKHACGVGLEGVVSKVRDSRYNSGRGNDWVKKTCAQRETLPIAGFAMKENKFDGLYLARLKGSELFYAGKVDHGFDTATAKDCRPVSNRWSGKRNPTPGGLRTAASGSSRRCWRKSNTGRSPPREKCDIRFSREYVRTSDGQGCI
jgi:bifunctional non-homologous end joining protein LigD